MVMKLLVMLRRFTDDEDGAFIVEFGIAFPLLLALTFGLLEFSLVVFDYQRAAEATRRGVRLTIINPPIPNTAQLLEGKVIKCTSTGGVVSCENGTPNLDADIRFQALLAEMQLIYPTLVEENLVVTYEGSNVGQAESAGGILPLVTLQLVNLRHDMMMGSMVGIAYIDFPDFKTSVLGPGNFVNVAPPVGNN